VASPATGLRARVQQEEQGIQEEPVEPGIPAEQVEQGMVVGPEMKATLNTGTTALVPGSPKVQRPFG
jgi:hypothetical protein